MSAVVGYLKQREGHADGSGTTQEIIVWQEPLEKGFFKCRDIKEQTEEQGLPFYG